MTSVSDDVRADFVRLAHIAMSELELAAYIRTGEIESSDTRNIWNLALQRGTLSDRRQRLVSAGGEIGGLSAAV